MAIQLKSPKYCIKLAELLRNVRLQRGGSTACPAAFATSKSTSTSGLQSSQRCPRIARPTQSAKRLRQASFHCRPRTNRASCPHPFGQQPSSESCGSRCWLHSSVHGMAISRCKYRAASCQSMDARQAAFNVPQSQRGNSHQEQTLLTASVSALFQSVHINFKKFPQPQRSSVRLSTQLNRRH